MLSERAFTLLLAAMTALTALSIDMSRLPAMPQMQRSFGASVSSVQLTLSIFLLGFAVGQLVAGPLSDRIGRRPVLLGGLGLFTAAGFICAASPSLPLLLLGRCLQGMGACVGPVVARAIVRDRFEGERSAAVLSQVTQVMILAPLIAPTLGGYVLVAFGWPAIFVLLGIAGAAIWATCRVRLPETRQDHGDAERPDFAREMALGFRQVLSHPASLRHTLTTCFTHAGMFAYISAAPFLYINDFGVPRQQFGLYFALTAAAFLAGATLNRILLPRISGPDLLRIGVHLVFAAAVALVITAWTGTGGAGALLGVLLPMMVYLLGLGFVQPNATALAMEPHARYAGIASSVIGSMQTAGGALAGYFVGAFYNHTPQSLAVTVAVLATLAFMVRDRPAPSSG